MVGCFAVVPFLELLGTRLIIEGASFSTIANVQPFHRFSNLDKLIHYVNLDGRVNTFYSTPHKYTLAKAASDVTWPTDTNDFFPYAGKYRACSCVWLALISVV